MNSCDKLLMQKAADKIFHAAQKVAYLLRYQKNGIHRMQILEKIKVIKITSDQMLLAADQSQKGVMPDLPTPTQLDWPNRYTDDLYTEQQMREYALDAILAMQSKDTSRLDFLQANPDMPLKKWKKHWSCVEQLCSYEYQVYETAREAVDAAINTAKRASL